MPQPSLLILIPAYNEEERIEPVLREYAHFFQREYRGAFQIVVVLNGCRDDTLGVVQRVARDFPSVKALEFKEPIGKGGALIEGLRLAPLGDLIGYVDADGASPPQSLLTLLEHVKNADCVIGSRWLPGATLHQAQPFVRQITSRAFHVIVEILFGMNIKDTQCPCKLMRRECVEKIHSSLLIADLAFDVNLLVSLKRAGFRVLEVPIEWTDKMGSKVSASLVRQSLTMFFSVVRLRLIYWPRLYGWLRLLRPLEGWVYKTLYVQPSKAAPQPGRNQKPKLT